MNLVELESVRGLMAEEIELDIVAGRLYRSPRLTDSGWLQYADFLLAAAQSHTDAWLADRIRNLLKTHEERRRKKGGYVMVSLPYTAADTLAEGEFNRFYIRGLCRDVIANGGTEVEIYRAKYVSEPRFDSEMRIGNRVDVLSLLVDLRENPSIETSLRIPSGPNSGISVRRVP